MDHFQVNNVDLDDLNGRIIILYSYPSDTKPRNKSLPIDLFYEFLQENNYNWKTMGIDEKEIVVKDFLSNKAGVSNTIQG